MCGLNYLQRDQTEIPERFTLGGRVLCADSRLQDLVQNVRNGLLRNETFELVSKGFSGTYQTYDAERNLIGIFKPRDESPYGKDNPKCLAFCRRNLKPGRIRTC